MPHDYNFSEPLGVPEPENDGSDRGDVRGGSSPRDREAQDATLETPNGRADTDR